MAVVRRTRILFGVLIFCLTLYSLRHYDALRTAPDWTSDPPTVYATEEEILLTGAAYSNPGLDPDTESGSLVPPDADDTGYTPVVPLLVDLAHKLPSADAFLPHFQAVTRLGGLTLAEAKASCVWAADAKVNFQFGSNQDWVDSDRGDSELAERRTQWRAFVDSDMVPWGDAAGKFSGRGIVVVAGNQDTLMRVRVMLRALLRLGSHIAVEVHYWGDEIDEAQKQELGALYFHIFFNDLSGPDNVLQIDKTGFYINYQLKTAAVVNSRFAEPLLLDSDNIPIVDPASLYDTPEYIEYGTLFWPDIARTRPQNPAWAITNTPCRMDEYEQESGQLLVDKRRYFYHLQLAAWLNNNADQRDYYQQMLLGDKDMFRFAWHALKTAYGRPSRWLTSVGTLNDGFYCGHTFAQHHPNGSVAFMHGGLVKTVDLETIRWNRDEAGGFYRYFKRSPKDEEAVYSVDVGIKFDGAVYQPEHSEGFHGGMCTDMFEVEARPLEELPELAGFEKMFEEIGGYWMLDEELA